MCCLKRAFDAPNLPALILKISKGNVQGSIPSQYSQTLVKLIDWMLATDPDERPNITQVMAHHWVAPYVYKLPTQLGVIPCTSFKAREIKDESMRNVFSDHSVNDSILFPNEPKQDSAPINRNKCIVVKLSTGGVRTMPMPEFDVDAKIIQICGKNMALTDSGNVIKWRTSNSKNPKEADSLRVDCLLYDSYFKNKGVKISYLATSQHFDCFITDRGILMTKGNGRYGCLGHGDRKSVIQPKIVEYFLAEEVKMIKCSDHHVVACTSRNEIYCWGQNVLNCFGLQESEHSQETKIFTSPLKVTFPIENSIYENVLDIFCAQGKTCILMNDRRTVFFAGNFNFSNEISQRLCGFSKLVETNDMRRIVDIELTSNKTLILYEDGSIKVSTTDSNRCNIEFRLNMMNEIHGNEHVSVPEKINTILLKEERSMKNGEHDQEHCLVICTNFNNIFICNNFNGLLFYSRENLVADFKNEKLKNNLMNIDMNGSMAHKFFSTLNTPFTKNEEISHLNFYQGDSIENKPTLLISSLSCFKINS